MRIADGLLLIKDISNEITHLNSLCKDEAWFYKGEKEKPVPTFDIEANRLKVRGLTKLSRTLSRAIAVANAKTDLDVDDESFPEWL